MKDGHNDPTRAEGWPFVADLHVVRRDDLLTQNEKSQASGSSSSKSPQLRLR
jgi:hypothetical protein